MVERIKMVHEANLIHRDLKPENFMVGRTNGTKQTVFIIDFGIAKRYRQPNGKHIPYRDGLNFTGNHRYASLKTLLGSEHSRRDDLENIGYILLYFLRG